MVDEGRPAVPDDGASETPEPEWPDHFPLGCPPQDARPVNEDVYRLVEGDEVAPDDMKSWLEIPRGSGRDCQRAGLSVVLDRGHADDLTTLPLHLGKRVATASLTPEHGKVKHTPTNKDPEHHTLWLRRTALRMGLDLFQVRR